MRKKIIVLGLILSLVLSVVPGLASAAKVPLGDTNFELTTDVSRQDAQIAAFEELKAMFTAAVDLVQVKAAYETKLQADVKARNTLIDESITVLLQGGIKGDFLTDQVKQAIDKGLQWFFYEEITHLTKVAAKEALDANDKAAAKAALEQAIRLYVGSVGVTAGKRDADFDTLTQVQLNTVIGKLQEAVENGDILNYNVYRQFFDKTMIKVFVMAAIKYAGKVEESYKAGKTDDAKKEQSEAYFFFMPIYNSMTSGSKVSADAIKDAFEQDAAKVKKSSVEAQLAKAISAKINGYVNKVFLEDLPNTDKALEHAAEGIAFAGALEIVIKDKLGAEAYAEFVASGEAFLNTVKENKINEAKAHAMAVLKIVAKVNGVQFKIGEKILIVNGKEVSNTEAASYLNKSTNRTLASARFIAEALGAQVNYDKAAKTVTLVTASDTVKMTIGSKDVYVNGKKSEVQLDQEAVLKDHRTYIPVRAFAEALGYKIFYFKGEIVIN